MKALLTNGMKTDCGPEVEAPDDDGWMDDLDEAAWWVRYHPAVAVFSGNLHNRY